MAFDLGTWIIGYSLSKLATTAIDIAKNESFSRELNSIVSAWAANLPGNLYVEPESIFPSSTTLSDRENEALEILRVKIITKELPTFNNWENAILEQWKIVRNKLGDGAQSFYTINEIEALVHIDNLANALFQKSKLNTDLFKNKVLNELELIKNMVDSLKPNESVQVVIQSKLSIIKGLKDSIIILQRCWPLNPIFTRDPKSHADIHNIVEKTVLNIHYSYSLILPYCDANNITQIVQERKNKLIEGLNIYLEVVDKFYDGDMESTMQVLDSLSPLEVVGNAIKKWKDIIILMREYLKIELEKE